MFDLQSATTPQVIAEYHSDFLGATTHCQLHSRDGNHYEFRKTESLLFYFGPPSAERGLKKELG